MKPEDDRQTTGVRLPDLVGRTVWVKNSGAKSVVPDKEIETVELFWILFELLIASGNVLEVFEKLSRSPFIKAVLQSHSLTS